MNINATLIGQAISFAIFVWFCMKYVWPPITAALQERQKLLSDGLQNAEKAQAELDRAKAEVSVELNKAKQQSAVLIEQANKRANQIVDDAKVVAIKEGERLKQAAQADIEQEINRAKEALRKQVSLLAIAGAEKILKREIDEARNRVLIDNLIEEI